MAAPTDPSDLLDRLAQEYVERARGGEQPSIEDYAREHPALADDIRELFPVLAIVEGLRPATGGESAGASKASDPASIRLPDRIGPYVVGGVIGRGGMGCVYEARREEDGERVAVKVIHRHLLDRPEYVARFLREAEAGRRVEHPSVVRTLDTGLFELDGEEAPYLALEYVDGQNLRALLEEAEVVPERLCRHIGTSVADALAAVHGAGLVHRDVKPENVVITPDETVKLMDLGVAVVQDRAMRLSQTGQFVGSLLYAAPDQVAGGDPDPRWDLHALGVVLHELATGRHPGQGRGLRWLRESSAARPAATPLGATAHLSPFFVALIDDLVSAGLRGAVATAAGLRDVLKRGERSAWWREQRDRAPTATDRLRRLERPTAFYGREAEWKVLDERFTRVRQGHGQVVWVEGEAGIGKTRLLYEWIAAQRATQSDPRVLLVPHDPGSLESNESRLALALAEHLGEEALERRLTDLLGSRSPLADALARRMRGEAAGSGATPPLDAGYLRLCRALARERPLLLLFEDLHFAREEDVDRFLFFARGVGDAPVLLVGTRRPHPRREVAEALQPLPNLTQLALGGLDTEACRDLVREAAAAAPHLGESLARLAQRSDRNPFFLIELAREHSRRLDERAEVPDSIRGLLHMRLTGLQAEDRELLEAAACAGHVFDPIVLADAVESGRMHTLKRLGRLERGERLLRPDGHRYAFQHHLLQEILYAELHPALCETYHTALGRALAARASDADGPHAVELATHFLKGSDPSLAVPYVRQALEHLEFVQDAYRQAEQLANLALGIPGLLRGGTRAAALHIRGRRLVSASRFEEAEGPLAEALELAQEAGDAGLQFDVLHRQSWMLRLNQKLEAAAAAAERCMEIARTAKNPGREAQALASLAESRVLQGRLDEAETLARRALAVVERKDLPLVEVRLRTTLSGVMLRQDRIHESRVHLIETRAQAHALGDVGTEFEVADYLGHVEFRCGRFRAALENQRLGLDLGRQLGLAHKEAGLLANMARCLVRLGRHDEALTPVDAAMAIAARSDLPFRFHYFRTVRAFVLDALGDLAEALEEGGRAIADAVAQERLDFYRGAALEHVERLSVLGRRDEAARLLAEAEERLSAPQAPRNTEAMLGKATGCFHEAAGRFEAACAAFAEVHGTATSVGLGTQAQYGLPLGRCRLRLGLVDEAVQGLREAIGWAEHSGERRHGLLAQCHLAALPEGDALAARVGLESHPGVLTAVARIEAYHALWTATGERADLEEAWHALCALRDGAPAEDRASILENVWLHREVARAWQEE